MTFSEVVDCFVDIQFGGSAFHSQPACELQKLGGGQC
jgi:hypothetical protein